MVLQSSFPTVVSTNGESKSSQVAEKQCNIIADSFLPIIKKLPGLILEENVYYLTTSLQASDITELVSYTNCVGTMTLNDSRLDQQPTVSPDILVRLAMIQDVKTPFFSSLKCLRLVDVDSELKFLWFCISPSLDTLEVSGIPQTRHLALSSFFNELVLKARQLANITLGPGVLPATSLQSAVKFNNLRRLHIADSATDLTFEFLREVSALPLLENFHIDARTAKYVASADTSVDVLRAHTAFPQLTKLTVISDALLLTDLLHCFIPAKVEEVSLTLIRKIFLCMPIKWEIPDPIYSTKTSLDRTSVDIAIKTLAELATFPLDLHRSSVSSVDIAVKDGNITRLDGGQLRLFATNKRLIAQIRSYRGNACDDLGHECDECRTLKAHKERAEEALRKAVQDEWRLQLEQRKPTLAPCVQVAHFAAIIEALVENARPRKIYIDLVDNTSCSFPSSTPAPSLTALPSNTLRKLLSCPSLSTLVIERWLLTPLDETFACLDVPSVHGPQPAMHTLRLPTSPSLSSGASLATLLTIARYYSRLHTLQLRLAPSFQPCLLSDYSGGAGGPSPHALHTLVVGSGELSMTDKLTIAPVIGSLFPGLNTISMQDAADARGTADWQFVHKLVKLCQDARNASAEELRKVCASV